MQPKSCSCFGTAGFGNCECQSRPQAATIHATFSNKLTAAPAASVRLSSGPHRTSPSERACTTAVPPLAPSRTRAGLHSLNTQPSQMKWSRSSQSTVRTLAPSPAVSEKHLRSPPLAAYLLEARWPSLPPFLCALVPLAGNTTPCSERRLGTGDLASSQHWAMELSTHTFPPPAHAVLAGQSHRLLQKAPKGYLGKLVTAATASDLLGALAQWLTTGDDK